MEHFKKHYVKGLINEIMLYKNSLKGFEIDTIFIGGGTPTCLNEKQIFQILDAVYQNAKISKKCEITIEANPGTVDFKKLSRLYEYKINRISFGVQSFIDLELKAIGRIHSEKEAIKAINFAKKAGFSNINIDLMFGIPNQTTESFLYSLNSAVSKNAPHISVYSLIIEENTFFYNNIPQNLPNEETERQQYKKAVSYLKSNGFSHYEISNFAKKGFECRHNLKYWKLNSYFGFGLNAHSFINGERYYNTSNLDEYLSLTEKSKLPIKGREALNKKDEMAEYIILGLRLNKGINKKQFCKKFGIDFMEIYGNIINSYIKSGHIKENKENIFLTQDGISISNTILCNFV